MSALAVDGLLREHQATVVSERRSVDRQPFARPVQIEFPRGTALQAAFSRDISRNGISLILTMPVEDNTIARLLIHRLYGSPAPVRAEARWCQPFGEGWYVSGWRFVD